MSVRKGDTLAVLTPYAPTPRDHITAAVRHCMLATDETVHGWVRIHLYFYGWVQDHLMTMTTTAESTVRANMLMLKSTRTASKAEAWKR